LDTLGAERHLGAPHSSSLLVPARFTMTQQEDGYHLRYTPQKKGPASRRPLMLDLSEN
jgi:hypothetical protein